MKTKLAYGQTGLIVDLPGSLAVEVLEPAYERGVENEHAAILDALAHPTATPPLRDMVSTETNIGIVFSDITRPTPNRVMLPVLLEELKHVTPERITLFNALGSHRANTEDELTEMLGHDIVQRFSIVQNDAFDPSTQIQIGTSRHGRDLYVHRQLMECDVKILTGFIEPHFFAGFSGGCKAVVPGMAGIDTIMANHDADMIGHPNATWGVCEGNPIRQEIDDVAGLVGQAFLLNVTLNKDGRITRVFAGDLLQAHALGCAYVKERAMVQVERPFDIVITTNSGYPLDMNLYQCVKGMSAAARIVRDGGAIILAAECSDGIPEHGLYGRLLAKASDPSSLLDKIVNGSGPQQDQWQAQIQAQILLKADVYLYSDTLSEKQIKDALLQPCARIETTVEGLMQKSGSNPSVCILPEGPQTIPYL